LSKGAFLQEEEGDWVKGRRAIIELARYRCRLWLAEASVQQGMPGQAETVLGTLLEEDSTDEDVLCRLMLLLHQQGMTHQALRLYQQISQGLVEDGLGPANTTQQFAVQLEKERQPLLIDAFKSQNRTPRVDEALSFPILSGHSFSLSPSQPSSSSEVLVPIAIPMQSLVSELPSLDIATWFAARVNDLKAMLTPWHGPIVPSHQHQALLHAEIERWNDMNRQQNMNSAEYRISRRMALATLATLSSSLLTRVQLGPLTALLAEEFLAQCAASLTSCWHLLNEDGLHTVEYILPRYLPMLISLAKQPSPYQRRAAYLAAQGCLLMDLVSYHHIRFQDSLSYATQAVELARVSGDSNLQVYSLMLQGGAFNLNGHKSAMLEKHQEAQRALNEVVPALRSYALAELAYAYAKNGKVQEALRSIGEARSCFPDEFGEVPCFVSADYGLFQLIAFEGMTHLALGEYDHDQKLPHTTQASKVLVQIEELPPELPTPERLRVEIVNYQTQAAIGIGNLDDFENYLIAGATGAKELKSEKRRQEAINNWKAASKKWPHEGKVLQLADALF
jgi:tetratricopeptide (TPR) repeat protein